MLTFVLLYIIIITNWGVITPTYVNIYMYSVYQNIISGRFRWEQYALIQEGNGLSSSTLRLWWYDDHLTNLLISFFSGYSPCSPSVYHHRWVSRKKERKLQCFRGMHLWYWESCYLSALPYSFSFSPQKKTIKSFL